MEPDTAGRRKRQIVQSWLNLYGFSPRIASRRRGFASRRSRVRIPLAPLKLRVSAVRCPPIYVRQLGSEAGDPALLEGLPELSLIGPLVALEHRLDRLPATEFAEHLERLVHQVGSELPSERMPTPARLRLQPREGLRLLPPQKSGNAALVHLVASIEEGTTGAFSLSSALPSRLLQGVERPTPALSHPLRASWERAATAASTTNSSPPISEGVRCRV